MPQPDDAPGRPRRLAERLLGSAAQPAPPPVQRPPQERPKAPRSVRWAAVVLGLEAVAILAPAGVLLFLALGSTQNLGNDLALAATVAVLGAALAACAAGLWRLAIWSRGPAVAMQILLVLMGLAALSQGGMPGFAVPALALAAVELYLLSTPEARLTFFRRRGD